MSPETVLGVFAAFVAVMLSLATFAAMAKQAPKRRSPFNTWMS